MRLHRKETRQVEIKGCGSGGSSSAGHLDRVAMQLEVTDPKDPGRPLQALMTPGEARNWAELLIKMAELVEERDRKKAAEAP